MSDRLPAPDHGRLEDVLSLLRAAGRIAGQAPAVEEVLRSGERERYPWASVGQAVRYALYGDGAGGTLEHPVGDSLLAQVASMTAWSDERWDRLYRSELADVEVEESDEPTP